MSAFAHIVSTTLSETPMLHRDDEVKCGKCLTGMAWVSKLGGMRSGKEGELTGEPRDVEKRWAIASVASK